MHALKSFMAVLLVGTVLPPAVAFAEPVVTETVDFEGYDRKATTVARRTYKGQFQFIEGKRVWLVEPDENDENEAQQIVFKMGPANCDPACDVGVLYYTQGQWLEIWREQAEEIKLGEVNPDTGLKDIIHGDRVWQWDGAKYWPQTLGDWPEIVDPSEEQVENALGFLRDELGLAENAPLNVQSAFNIELKNGGGMAIRINTPATCEGPSGACPVVFLDDDNRPIGFVKALNGDVRLSYGTDQYGYKIIEAATTDGVAQLSPVSGKTPEGALMLRAQPITRAGDRRPTGDELKAPKSVDKPTDVNVTPNDLEPIE